MNLQPQNLSHNNLDVRGGWSRPPLMRMENLIAIPGYSCLYRLNGSRVEETRRDFLEGSRFDFNAEPTQAPRFCDQLLNAKFSIVKEPILFGGQIGSHYGHFLSDHLSRIWPLYDREYIGKILFLIRSQKEFDTPFVKTFFELAEIKVDSIYIPREPTLFEKVFIPIPSIQQIQRIYSVHKNYHEYVANKILNLKDEIDEKPVYISRSRLLENKRVISNEKKLEQLLVKYRYKIVYPESLTLVEQVQLFNSQKPIVGSIGSGFHNSLFTLNDNKVAILTGDSVNPRYLLIDNIKQLAPYYLNVCKPIGLDGKTFEFDLEKTLDFLSDKKFI